MLIRTLSGSSPRPWTAELHPRLTVVRGVPDSVAAPLRAAIDALVRARISGPELAAAGLGGRVEVDGIEIPLEDMAERAPGLVPSTPRTHGDLMGPLRALGAARQRALDAEAQAARSVLADAEAALAQARDAWTASHSARTTRMADDWRTRAEAADALRHARRRAADAAETGAVATVLPPVRSDTGEVELRLAASGRVDATRAARAAAAAAVAEAEDLRTRAAAAGPDEELDRLRAELDASERKLAATALVPPVTPEERRAAVDHRARVLAGLEAIEVKATERVAAAVEAAERHGGIAAVEAAQVAVEWERVRDLVADETAAPAVAPAEAPLGAGGIFTRTTTPEPSSRRSADASTRLRVAQDRIIAARRGVAEATSSEGLDSAEVEALEAAHAEVLEAWEGSERRIGVGKARRRLEDAQMAEREVLGRMGFASYTEFMMSGRTMGMPTTLDVDNARRSLTEAEAHLAEVEAELEAEATAVQPAPAAPRWDADAARGRLAATLDALRARAADLLGEDPGDDVAARLRQRIAADPVSDLRLALDEVGLPLGELPSRDEVLARGRAWLAQQAGAESRRAALAEERVEAEDHLARLDAADGAGAAREAMVRRRDELRTEVGARTASAGAVDAAEQRLGQDREALARAAAEQAEAEAAVTSVEALTSDGVAAAAPVHPVDVDLAALESESRDAQTALDVAMSRLLPRPGGDDADAEADATLGRAEARVELARIELAGLEQIQAERSGEATGAEALDVDTLIWQVLARMASQRDAAASGGPGPTPLVLDEPFGDLDGASVVRFCDALVGPAAAVQTVVFTARPEVADWLDGADPELAAAATVGATPADASA